MSDDKEPTKQLVCPNEADLIRYCKRCHRKLKAAASMKIGLGRVCAKKERARAIEKLVDGAVQNKEVA